MINYDYIQGERFMKLNNGIDIFYIDTHNVNNFLKNPPKNEFVLITHNSDGKITDSPNIHDADVKLMPDNLLKWYGQNVCYKHDKIISLPIGLENSKWFPHIGKINQMKNKLNDKKLHRNLLYVNHNINTNKKERVKPYELFSNKQWAVCENKPNGFGFENYIDNIYNHKFVLSPEGNGTDTHRLWECLYLNTIPVEKRNINNSFYEDLPICFVNDWEEITEEFLLNEFDRISNNKYNLNKLNFKYWSDLILSK